ncbi:MAG TPA: YbjN domain-containing protein [Acidimicrobiales bacterium]|nr:YbjN domain-containing protein [Acidimicrobiales bacterium]
MTPSDAEAARSRFVAAQVAALEPLDFVVVGPPTAPLDAVRVLREADGSLALSLPPRELTPEQSTTLTGLGLSADPGASTIAADPGAAAASVDAVLAGVFGVDGAAPVDVRHGSEREVRAAAEQVEEMRRRIEPVLTAINAGVPVAQDEDGDYLLDVGHVRVFVAPRSLPGRPPPIIRVFAITNAGVPPSPELGLFLARLNFTLMFGRFSIDTEQASIWFDETLLGEHVTDEELRFTVEMVAGTANEWVQKLASMFGGRVRPATEAVEPVAGKPGQGGYL